MAVYNRTPEHIQIASDPNSGLFSSNHSPLPTVLPCFFTALLFKFIYLSMSLNSEIVFDSVFTILNRLTHGL